MSEEKQIVATKDYRDAVTAAWELKALVKAMLAEFDADGNISHVLRLMIEDRLIILAATLGHPDLADIPF